MFALVITEKHVLLSLHLSPSRQLISDALQFITLGDKDYKITKTATIMGLNI